MAKQKIVTKMAVNNEKKSRKALRIVVGISGVESVSFVGSDKRQIELTGEKIDSVELAKLLRKSIGHTDLASLGSVEETNPAAPGGTPEVRTQAITPQFYPHHYSYDVPYHIVYEGPYNNDPSCTII